MTGSSSVIDVPVSWLVDEIEVNAFLTTPSGGGPFPAVIMVAGSGPTDRNWNSPLIPGTNGSAALLAHALTEAGFITLRYDKRASGPKVMENLPKLAGKISMQGHLDEVAGGVQYLANRPDVNRSRIFALTNSEGCIHALNYQNQAAGVRFAGFVLTSAPSRPIGVVGRGQIAAQFSAIPSGDQFMAMYDAAIQNFVSGQPVTIDEALPEPLRNLIQAITAPFNQPFSRELWVTDPSKLLMGITEPVLLLLGKKDIQVDWQIDGQIFDEIVKKSHNVQIVYMENANHVLKFEPKPMAELTVPEIMAAYNADAAQLDPATGLAIISWLKSQS